MFFMAPLIIRIVRERQEKAQNFPNTSCIWRVGMKRMGNETEIRGFLNSNGIPMMGISAVHELPRVPEDFSAKTTLEGAKSIICYGVPMPLGIIHGSNNDLALYWRCCNMLYRSLDTISNRLCLMLEEKGYLANPVYGCFPWKLVNEKFWGLLPLVYWAEQAGLGKLTRCGLLASPGYGTRILLGGVVTTCLLETTGKFSDELCPSDCYDCIEVCPVNAIEKTGKVDHNVCIRYSGANPLMAHLLGDREIKEKFSFETILNTVGVDDHGSYLCNSCVKVCPLNRK
jgi:epoxyqueuosine reductase QueG